MLNESDCVYIDIRSYINFNNKKDVWICCIGQNIIRSEDISHRIIRKSRSNVKLVNSENEILENEIINVNLGCLSDVKSSVTDIKINYVILHNHWLADLFESEIEKVN